ncbi:MAG TPA: hypothetical protein VI365_25840 [Trebonia sp.]
MGDPLDFGRDARGPAAKGVQVIRRAWPACGVDADEAALELEAGGVRAVLAVRLFQEPASELGREQAAGPRPRAADQVAAGRADHVLLVELLVAGRCLREAAWQRAVVLKKAEHGEVAPGDVVPAADGAGDSARAAGLADLVPGHDPPFSRPARATNRLFGVPELAVWAVADAALHQAERSRDVERGQEPWAGVPPGGGTFSHPGESSAGRVLLGEAFQGRPGQLGRRVDGH